MIRTVLRLRLLWRYVFPTADDRAYLAVISRAGAFDRRFYLMMNPRLRRIFRIWPERHYILVGEAVGLMPSKDFSPLGYLHVCPAASRSGLAPLRHFLASGSGGTVGGGQSDTTQDLSRGYWSRIGPDLCPDRPAPFAVAVHVHYPELWDEIELRLLSQAFAFDLYVTVSGKPCAGATMEKRIRTRFPQAVVLHVPNHGRDILPFVMLARQGLLAGYKAICKMHTKKSPHLAEGSHWRTALYEGVMGHPRKTHVRLHAFLNDAEVGLWTASGQLRRGADWWGYNEVRARDILARAGLPEGPLIFASGSMFWIKPEVVRAVLDLDLAPTDFEAEDGRLDGTTAHAVERLIGVVAAARGLRLVEASTLDRDTGRLDLRRSA